jgi:hypothetical protein
MRIRFLPQRPSRHHFVRLALERLGWPLVRDRGRVDLGFKWRDDTRVPTPTALRRLARRVPVLNLEAVDISKSEVHRVYTRVFGNPLGLDPRSHHGPAVCKSEANYRHDGTIVNCPIEWPEPGRAYAKLIDNRRDPAGRLHTDLVFDLRTPVFRGVGIPYVLVKYKRREERFGAGSTSAPTEGVRYELLRPDEVYDPAEQAAITRLCEEMGLDVSELDVLRDVDGTPYVVDVNWTPATPTRTLSPTDRARVVEAWSAALEACARSRVAQHTATRWRPSFRFRHPASPGV